MHRHGLELVGWIGNLILIAATIPLVWDAVFGTVVIPIAFLVLWIIGELFVLVYVVPKGHRPLITKHAIVLICMMIVACVQGG